jgi:hypothetical protein
MFTASHGWPKPNQEHSSSIHSNQGHRQGSHEFVEIKQPKPSHVFLAGTLSSNWLYIFQPESCPEPREESALKFEDALHGSFWSTGQSCDGVLRGYIASAVEQLSWWWWQTCLALSVICLAFCPQRIEFPRRCTESGRPKYRIGKCERITRNSWRIPSRSKVAYLILWPCSFERLWLAWYW